MSYVDNAELVESINSELSTLPTGSIGKKKIKGREYLYHRWYENGRRKERYVNAEEADELRLLLERRKELLKELKLAKAKSVPELSSRDDMEFRSYVRMGDDLRQFSHAVRKFKKRKCYNELHDFLYGGPEDKVLVLCGLRRTGKTTLIRQALLNMKQDDLCRAAFIQATSKTTLADINRDLRTLSSLGCKYVFVDEVTLIDDFIEGAALFSDVFATTGMRIVLSGTDSLGFVFAEDDQLYDRCVMIRTTFISYGEFESVLGIKGIDEFIRYGGTMSLSGEAYNADSIFSSVSKADEYVDSAIARNIQHSLKHYQHGGHFRGIQSLYDKGELTSAINRVVEDINHRFTVDVLVRDFESHDLALSARNLRNDRESPTDVLDTVDTRYVTEHLRKVLDVLNRPEQSIEISEAHAAEIYEYLRLLDLIKEVDIVSLPDLSRRNKRVVVSQPGLRYAQAAALVESLLLDQVFSELPLSERDRIVRRILSEVRGRMMEDIVLLETKLAMPQKQVFTLQFAVGEFDMVVFDPEAATCEVFEIKHSDKIVGRQYRHLVDGEKCAATEHRFGAIVGKYVIYRGSDELVDGVGYRNVEKYLRELDGYQRSSEGSFSR